MSPLHPALHEHLNDSGWLAELGITEHEAPLRHGAVAHTLSATSQLTPEKPSGHLQTYSSGAGLSQVPPFLHGS